MAEIEVVIEGSGKHCHVTREALDALYGQGYELEVKNWLSQPGQYVSNQKVTVVGPKNRMDVSIIGPCRKHTQVELSYTDAVSIGLRPPVRESGHLENSPGCTIIGPKGQVTTENGVIVAKRHIHLTPEDAERFGIHDQQIVKVRCEGPRALIFDEVVCRVSPEYATFMHIDYDELNAAAIRSKDPIGKILL